MSNRDRQTKKLDSPYLIERPVCDRTVFLQVLSQTTAEIQAQSVELLQEGGMDLTVDRYISNPRLQGVYFQVQTLSTSPFTLTFYKIMNVLSTLQYLLTLLLLSIISHIYNRD